jgi:hypothetical protein
MWTGFRKDYWPLSGAYSYFDRITSDETCPPLNTPWDVFGNVASCKWAGVDASDECDPDPCDPNATCTDLHEDYRCECNDLYEGDGETCTLIPDVDECDLGTHNCSANAICTDDRIDYTCECATGFKDSMQVLIHPAILNFFILSIISK